MSDELPEGWEPASLRELVSKLVDGSHNPPAKQPAGLPMLSARNVNGGRIVFDEYRLISRSDFEVEHRRTNVQEGDVLLTIVGSIGRVAVVPVEVAPFCLQRSVAVLRPQSIDASFLAFQLESPRIQKFLEEKASGTAQKGIYLRTLGDLIIRVAPIREQRRIVEKVEALLACVNAARERLAKVPVILKRFRQAVLAAACSGRLTEGWRKMHRQVVPMGAMLQARRTMARPAVERSARADTCQELATRDLPEIPETWGWARLPELGELNRGKSRHRPRNDPSLLGGNYPFIQTGDVARSDGKITSHSQTYNEAGLAQSRLWPARTVCITIAANIAESALLTYPACFPDSVVGLIADSSLCVAEYAEFFVRTARDDLSQYAPATAQKNINLEILRDVAVPLPPIEEQTEIVQHVEAFLSLVSTVERRVAAATTRTDKLTQSILAKAFRGELVPTEAELARQEGRDYEPASALLERIRAEQAATASGTEGAKPRRTLGRTKRARRGKATSSGR